MKVRQPCQAGMFYADSSKVLTEQIEDCFTHKLGPGKLPTVSENGPRQIVGLVCPHAGYVYSGPAASHAYYNLANDGHPDTVVLLGPNHTGRGSALATMNEGIWRTPLGDVEIDSEAANRILNESNIIDVDDLAHTFEHSIEVQLPFLQYLYGRTFKFVPICFLMQDLKTSRDVGKAVAKALSSMNALVIASTDLNHYETHNKAKLKDKAALDAMLNLDAEQLYSAIESHRISMCGYGPTAALIVAAKLLGATKANLLCYNTSGDVSGDFSAVVGYASVSFIK